MTPMPSLSGAFNNQKHCTHRQAPTPIPVVPLRCLGLWTARMETEPTVTLTLSAACTSHLSGASKIFFLLSPSSHLQMFYFKGSSCIKSMLIICIYMGILGDPYCTHTKTQDFAPKFHSEF